MGIAVILGHLMHSNGGPFTTSFYLNGPKSRGRKQLNNKLQICFFSLGRQSFFGSPVWTSSLPFRKSQFFLKKSKSSSVEPQRSDYWEEMVQYMATTWTLDCISCHMWHALDWNNRNSIFDDDDDHIGEKGDGQWMFMGNVRVVDNWKAIFTPIPLFFHSFSWSWGWWW